MFLRQKKGSRAHSINQVQVKFEKNPIAHTGLTIEKYLMRFCTEKNLRHINIIDQQFYLTYATVYEKAIC